MRGKTIAVLPFSAAAKTLLHFQSCRDRSNNKQIGLTKQTIESKNTWYLRTRQIGHWTVQPRELLRVRKLPVERPVRDSEVQQLIRTSWDTYGNHQAQQLDWFLSWRCTRYSDSHFATVSKNLRSRPTPKRTTKERRLQVTRTGRKTQACFKAAAGLGKRKTVVAVQNSAAECVMQGAPKDTADHLQGLEHSLEQGSRYETSRQYTGYNLFKK